MSQKPKSLSDPSSIGSGCYEQADPCPHCAADRSPFFDWARSCCRVRYVAGLPRDHRHAYYRDLAARDGMDTAKALAAAVNQYLRERHTQIGQSRPNALNLRQKRS